jgi:hypothetical protein
LFARFALAAVFRFAAFEESDLADGARWAISLTERACPNLTIAVARSSPDYFPYA